MLVMETYIPLISTRTKGPLGLVHLPRLWLKMRFRAKAKLAEAKEVEPSRQTTAKAAKAAKAKLTTAKAKLSEAKEVEPSKNSKPARHRRTQM